MVCQDFKLGGHEEGPKHMNSPNYNQTFLFRGTIISFRIVESAGGTTDDALFPFLILSQNGGLNNYFLSNLLLNLFINLI